MFKTPLGFSSILVNHRNLLVPFSRHWFVVCYFLHSLGWLGHDRISQFSTFIQNQSDCITFIPCSEAAIILGKIRQVYISYAFLIVLRNFVGTLVVGGFFFVSGSFLSLYFPCLSFPLCFIVFFCFYISFKSSFLEKIKHYR